MSPIVNIIINYLRCKVNTFLGIMQIYLNFELRISNYEKMTCSKCSYLIPRRKYEEIMEIIR